MEPEDDAYKFWGNYEFVGSMHANSLKSGLRGPNNIVFASDGQHIRFRVPDFKLGGTVMGERTVESDGNIVFEDLTNHRKAVVCFNTYKKSGVWTVTESGQKDEYVGVIYKCKPIDHVKSAKKLYSKKGEKIKDLSKIDDMVKKICDIKGSFLKHLVIDGKKYWDINEDAPFR